MQSFCISAIHGGQMKATRAVSVSLAGSPARRASAVDSARVTTASARLSNSGRAAKRQAFDQDIFRHIGVDPSAEKILVLKSTCHFRADFEPVAERVLIGIAPGAHLVDSTTYPLRHLRPGVRLAPMGPPHSPA